MSRSTITEGYFKLLGINPTHGESHDNWLTDLTVGNVYYKEMGRMGFTNPARLDEPKRDWSGYSWERVENTKLADIHEQETFGPLSSDPLINPKKSRGAVKAPFHATPELANIQMSNVMAGGGWKYGDFNYHKSPVDAQTYLSAMRRHYLLWKDGVDLDKESGQNHLAHVMACCAILIESQATGKFIDNRSKTGLVEEALLQSSATFNTYCETVEPIDGR